MELNDEFFENLPDDDYEAAYRIALSFIEFDENIPEQYEEDNLDGYLKYVSAIEALRAVREIDFGAIVIEKSHKATITGLRTFFDKVKENSEGKVIHDSVTNDKNRFKKLIQSKFRYEFTDGDLSNSSFGVQIA